MKKVIQEIIRQIFGKGEELPREGKLVLTKHAYEKMVDWGLDNETLKLTYQVGDKRYRKNEQVFEIVRKYEYYKVGMWFVEEYQPVKREVESEKIIRVITCWKGAVRV